jgi:hypothetical protein
MSTCLLCGTPTAAPLIDFGHQPLCNRFLATSMETEAAFRLELDLCRACGLVQLGSPAPVDELRPRVDWLTYNEPEGHLDDLAVDIARLPGITPANASLCGISFKDDSLLCRLQKMGFGHTRRLDPRTDLGIDDSRAGIETVSASLTPERAHAWVKRYGPANVVIARHILEHAYDPRGFASALSALMAPEGYLVIEIPDCEKALTVCDYTTVWEEHTLYFTPHTFHEAMAALGFAIENAYCIPYILENSLIAVMKVAREPRPSAPAPESATREIDRAELFATSFVARRAEIIDCLESFRRDRGRIALFGAGHLACTFVNLFGLRGLIDCVIDDNPRKVGLFMPGSRLPIVGSAALVERDIALCLLSINAAGEQSVIDKQAGFVSRGGVFRSIFPASPLAITR